MAKTIRLKESDLNRIIQSIVVENKKMMLNEAFNWNKLFRMLIKAAVGALIGMLFSKRPPKPNDIAVLDEWVRDVAEGRQDPKVARALNHPMFLELESKILQVRDAAKLALETGQFPDDAVGSDDYGMADDFKMADRGEMMMESKLLNEGWLKSLGNWFSNRWDDFIQALKDEWTTDGTWMVRPPSDPTMADRGDKMMEMYKREAQRKYKDFKVAKRIYENRRRYPRLG